MYNPEIGLFKAPQYGVSRAHSPNRGAAFAAPEGPSEAEKREKTKMSITAELMYKRSLVKTGVVVPEPFMAAWEEMRPESFAIRNEIDVLEAIPEQAGLDTIDLTTGHEVVRAAEQIAAESAEQTLANA